MFIYTMLKSIYLFIYFRDAVFKTGIDADLHGVLLFELVDCIFLQILMKIDMRVLRLQLALVPVTCLAMYFLY